MRGPPGLRAPTVGVELLIYSKPSAAHEDTPPLQDAQACTCNLPADARNESSAKQPNLGGSFSNQLHKEGVLGAGYHAGRLLGLHPKSYSLSNWYSEMTQRPQRTHRPALQETAPQGEPVRTNTARSMCAHGYGECVHGC